MVVWMARLRKRDELLDRTLLATDGLAAVRSIVDQHGGSVTALSREGRGSTFTVRLPLTRPD